ncbi:tripartite tricarboxylate transporter substrate-binding protein [Bacillus sp. Marseille-P3661]|uniref:tripartite tricarboxylate transporter substrate-binding protein n=1 Tax=Bacillus sp. Marseille-P3661 TaxID=1936234 RepID=UPI000C85D9C2|nr:tripartite tricarboxylate transporter substrate-binding protein [Bacillus sp. Marseille-P3661]
MSANLVKRGMFFLLALTFLVMMAACGGTENATSSENSSNQESANTESESGTSNEEGSKETAGFTYEGETITMIIGYAPGGGTDTEGRIVAKHLPKYLPGNPKIIVKNLPGGGGISAANVMFNDTKPDGLTIALPGRANWVSSDVLNQESVNYDLNEFEWIGNSGSGDMVLVVSGKSGLESIDDLKAAPKDSVLFGSWTKTGAPYVIPYLLNKELAPAVKPVTGYDGAGGVLLAMERGEVQGAVIAHAAITEADLESGKLKILATSGSVDVGPNVPKIEDFLSEEQVQILNLTAAPGLGVPMVAPPNTDPEIVNILRTAYMEMMKDPEFLEENKAQSILLYPKNGEELAEMIKGYTETPENVIAEVQKIITG